MVVLGGEAGIGKSALAASASAAAGALGFRITTGRAWEFADAPPWFPLRACFRSLGIASSLLPSEESDAFGLWEDVLEALARETHETPTLWILEDMHAADAQTLDLLAFLAQPIRALRAVILVTIRSTDARISDGPAAARLARIGRAGTTLELPRLAAADVEAIATRIAGPAASLILPDLLALTAGNPLFVVECAKALQTSRDGRAHLPRTIVQVVLDGMRALPDTCRALLESSAVLGRDVVVSSVARMTGVLPAVVADGLLPAVRAGILEELAPGRFRFSHALVRDAIHDAIPVARRREEHARAEAALAGLADTPDRVIERAWHALDAGGAIPEAHVRDIVTRAVTLLSEHGAPDRAFALQRRLLESLPGQPEPAMLLDALRLASDVGMFREARPFADQALAASRRANDASLFARVALAMGAYLRPGYVDPALVKALQEADERLGPEGDRGLRCRVRARLAAALQPAAEPAGPVAMARAAMADARTLADPVILRDVLLSGASALTDFTDAVETNALAAELLDVGTATGDSKTVLRALSRLAIGQLELARHAEFERTVDRALELARSIGHPMHAWRPLLTGSMRALAHGNWDESERLLTEAEQLSSLVDDPAMNISLAAHRSYRLLALDDPDAVPQVKAGLGAHLDTLPRAKMVKPFILALIACRLEDRDAASRELPVLVPLVLESASPAMLVATGEAVSLAGDTEQRQSFLERLIPYADRESPSGHVAITYEGPTARVIALLEASLGQLAEAESTLRSCRNRCEAVGFAPWVARLSLDLARVVRSAGREDEAIRLFEDAARQAAALRMKGVASRAQEALRRPAIAAPSPGKSRATNAPSARAPAPPAPAQPVAPSRGVEIEREGDVWRVSWEGRMTRVRETRGLRMLARLAAAPGERIHALALESDDLDGENKPGESDAGPALDPTALRQYRTRLAELDADLAEAESDADMGRVANIRRERDFLIAEITRAVGLGGRLRKVGSATERARVNVTRRIKDAVARVADGDAEIGRHLEAAIRTGTYCTYRP